MWQNKEWGERGYDEEEEDDGEWQEGWESHIHDEVYGLQENSEEPEDQNDAEDEGESPGDPEAEEEEVEEESRRTR